MASANQLMKEMQKIASNAQVQVQKLANQATEKSFQYNAQEANTARQWQTEMSNTAHQREVADLKKAGLNPVLAANNGAQSYTTSSASAQANDPSGAYGSLANALISSRTSAYGADTSAAATRAAAAQSAAATRYAAAQSASAQRYAAALAYQNNREQRDFDMKYMKEEYKQKITLANSTPTSSVGGVLDKLAQKAGLYDLVGTKSVKDTVSGMKTFLNNPSNFFANKDGAVTKKNFVLNGAGNSLINRQLGNLGVNKTAANRNLFVRAVVFRDPTAFNAFASLVRSSRSNRRYTGIQM